MSRTVTVGLDGSNESLAAAEWAAREARLRALPLRLVNVWEPQPYLQAPLLGGETLQHWAERVPRETADELRLRHPDVEIIADQVAGRPGTVLPDETRDAELLVLGSRGLSGVAGFMVGSVAMAAVAHAERPVVLVRAQETAGDERKADSTAYRPVVLGLDIQHADDSVIEFAFDAAARRATALHVVHGWSLPPYYAYGLPADPRMTAQLAAQHADSLAETLRLWRQKFPAVEVIERSRSGKPANHLVDASHDSSLVVVGRRTRRSPLGAHIGPVTHAVLHHATSPVAVVPHD
ncbi:universal stress protein [Streptomyces sp. NPDC005283]|uniref:universal stress protein n=1 Tax=Streptomyces sp. NPDC005283 TaxID=3156871 RepID=UPI0034528570